MADLFISYAREDLAFVRELSAALRAAGKEPWVDLQDIPPTARWRDEVRGAIDQASAVIYVLSPESVASAVCREELERALTDNKRVIPVLLRDVDPDAVPEPVAEVNWIPVEGGEVGEAAARIGDALDVDLDWVRAHTRLLTRAVEWNERGRDRSLLLRGGDLEAAERWLTEADRHRDPQPTQLQTEFVIASRGASSRTQRIRLSAALAALAVTSVLAVVAFLQSQRAREQARLAGSRELAAAALLRQSTDPRKALSLALEASRRAPTVQAVQALRQALVGFQLRRVLRTDGPASGAAFSPDGARVAAGGRDATVRVWDVRGELDVEYGGHDAAVLAVAWDPEGVRIASVDRDGAIHVWDAESGRPVAALEGHEGKVFTLAWSPDAQTLGTGGEDGTVRLWDVDSGREVRRFDLAGRVFAMAWSPDGTQVVATEAESASVWDVRTERSLLTLTGHEAVVNGVAWSPDGERIVTASNDGTARIWDGRTGRVSVVLRGHTGLVYSAAFSPDGERVVTAADDGSVREWVAATGPPNLEVGLGDETVALGEPLQVLRGHAGLVRTAAYAPDGGSIVSAGEDGTVRVWTSVAGEALHELAGHTGWVHRPSFAAEGGLLVTPADDRTARLWDGATGEPSSILRGGHSHWVWTASFDPRAERVVTASQDGTAVVWDLASREPVATIDARGRAAVTSAAFDREGRRVVISSDLGEVSVRDPETGAELGRLPGFDVPAYDASFGPGGERIAAASADKTARVWSASGADVATLRHPDIVTSVAWSPDGRRLLTGCADGTARVWDVGRERTLLSLQGHTDLIWDVDWSPDGRFVATASHDLSARVWDAGTGLTLDVLRGHHDAVRGVAFSLAGTLATTSADGVVRLFRCATCAPLADLQRDAEARLARTG
jgi:WD40 repeat protein